MKKGIGILLLVVSVILAVARQGYGSPIPAVLILIMLFAGIGLLKSEVKKHNESVGDQEKHGE